MATSRREFLKATAVVSAGTALSGVSVWAQPEASTASGGASASAAALEYTRGVGIYPGLPSADFGPQIVADTTSYRNLALLRPAYASSSYDYNLTAQLVTDGIRHTRMPQWVSVSDSNGEALPRESREQMLDHAGQHLYELHGSPASFTLQLGGGEQAPEIDRIELIALAPKHIAREKLTFRVLRSIDGHSWEQAGETRAPEPHSIADFPPDFAAYGNLYMPSIPCSSMSRDRFYKVEFLVEQPDEAEAQVQWAVGQIAFFRAQNRVNLGGPYSFTSAWMSAGMDEEWVSVDLGAICQFDRVKLYWIARAAEGSVEASDDGEHWRAIASLDGRSGLEDDIRLDRTERARYVRLLMRRPTSPEGFLLSQLEVWGRGGFVARPNASQQQLKDGRLNLDGGAWRLERSSLIAEDGAALSHPGYRDDAWLAATVPGTILTSYLNAGAIPDPNFGSNQLHISDSFFYSDFWYRKEFVSPTVGRDERVWLNFDGINWKAEVWLNGEKLGRIEGGFLRGRFDVTGKLAAGKPNVLAVRIEKNHTPGSAKQKTLEKVGPNGGAPGSDDPTYHASIGWDWIPTIRGRNTGIWGDVYLETTGAVTLENPFVCTELPLPSTTTADVIVELDAANHRPQPFDGVLDFSFGEVHVQERLQLAAGERRTLRLNPSSHPELRLKEPKLWWPVGYGEPHLYPVKLSVSAHGRTLDHKEFQSGVRQMTASEEGGALRLWVNGRRFIARGGNWGFSESMLRYRAREYDAAVRYHREMNFTLIRNWVGQIGDDAFFDACDRHGVMVWQDFWLANPWDGPSPDDHAMFLANARDFVLRIRNHASIGVYCGRNEGFPPKPLDDGIRKILADLHPGLHYISSSADGPVSGHGPYQAKPREFYFETADTKLHSEIGAPAIPPIESVRAMMPSDALWPQGLDWGLHDFCLDGAQGGKGFRSIIDTVYGGADSAEEWIKLAQFVNYETYRAMFEAQSRHRMGVLLWMSHSCWPSFVWQTYDYYFEPTAAYFGSKKGSEPLHILWDSAADSIVVTNLSAGNQSGLTAGLEILNMDGKLASHKQATVDVREDSTAECFKVQYPDGLSDVHFLRLKLSRGAQVVSTNFYLRPARGQSLCAIRELPTAVLEAKTAAVREGSRFLLTTTLRNSSATPALMVRLKAVREKSGDRILPAIYSDNYLALMPGESRTITTELALSDTRGEQPAIVVEA